MSFYCLSNGINRLWHEAETFRSGQVPENELQAWLRSYLQLPLQVKAFNTPCLKAVAKQVLSKYEEEGCEGEPQDKPFTVHGSKDETIKGFKKMVSEEADRVIQEFWSEIDTAETTINELNGEVKRLQEAEKHMAIVSRALSSVGEAPPVADFEALVKKRRNEVAHNEVKIIQLWSAQQSTRVVGLFDKLLENPCLQQRPSFRYTVKLDPELSSIEKKEAEAVSSSIIRFIGSSRVDNKFYYCLNNFPKPKTPHDRRIQVPFRVEVIRICPSKTTNVWSIILAAWPQQSIELPTNIACENQDEDDIVIRLLSDEDLVNIDFEELVFTVVKK